MITSWSEDCGLDHMTQVWSNQKPFISIFHILRPQDIAEILLKLVINNQSINRYSTRTTYLFI